MDVRSADLQGQGDVLRGGLIDQHVGVLEDESDLLIADSVPVSFGQPGHLDAVEAVASFGGDVEQAQEIQECALARPGRSGDRDEFTARHGERDGCQ